MLLNKISVEEVTGNSKHFKLDGNVTLPMCAVRLGWRATESRQPGTLVLEKREGLESATYTLTLKTGKSQWKGERGQDKSGGQ